MAENTLNRILRKSIAPVSILIAVAAVLCAGQVLSWYMDSREMSAIKSQIEDAGWETNSGAREDTKMSGPSIHMRDPNLGVDHTLSEWTDCIDEMVENDFNGGGQSQRCVQILEDADRLAEKHGVA